MKAVSVFSGGLDSLLATELVRAQGIEVLAVFFQTPFFGPEKARGYAGQAGIPLKVVDLGRRHLEVVKNPAHGYGGGMNPCIDCHALMIRAASEMLPEEGASFIITGEVLGQRPMSQNRKALSIVENESGYAGLLLRPLSAKKLPPTLPEERGWVDREALKGISGRSRKPQMALARELGITGYPAPAGGCLLTDQGFSSRLRDLLLRDPDPSMRDIELLKLGRHFRLDDRTRLIVGRNQRENELLQSLAGEKDTLIRPVGIPGPTVLSPGSVAGTQSLQAACIAASYSDAGQGQETELRLQEKGGERLVRATARDKNEFRALMV